MSQHGHGKTMAGTPLLAVFWGSQEAGQRWAARGSERKETYTGQQQKVSGKLIQQLGAAAIVTSSKAELTGEMQESPFHR